MLVTGLCFIAVTALVKIVGDGLPAAQSAFLRYVLGIVFLVPMLPAVQRAWQRGALAGQVLPMMALRGLVHSLGVILWFFAMTRIPIAEVTAMNYMSPIYVTLGAALFLGERLALRRMAAIAVALIGALIILRPGFREVSVGHYAMIGTALAFAASYLIAGRFAAQLGATTVVAMLSITVTIGLAPFALAVWVTPDLTQMAILFGVAAFATGGHYAMTLAFAAAPMTVTQPVTFLQLLWSVLLGATFFNEGVDFYVVLGGGFILAAVSFITWREAVLKRAKPPV